MATGRHSLTDMATTQLIVIAGRPGTGKTTLSGRLTTELGAAYLRIDVIETAVVRSGLASYPVGPVGYVVAHEVAASNLALGTSVVVDAVNPVHGVRAGWYGLASMTGVKLTVFETFINDETEHRRRVSSRQPDMPGQYVPTWDEVQASPYDRWDVDLDGPRVPIDMAQSEAGFHAALRDLTA